MNIDDLMKEFKLVSKETQLQMLEEIRANRVLPKEPKAPRKEGEGKISAKERRALELIKKMDEMLGKNNTNKKG